MKAEITRPEKCPHYYAGMVGKHCLYPATSSPLACDYSPSARGKDGFPKDCPLRGEAWEN